MFSALRPFQTREPFVPDYQAPAIDVVNDNSGVLVMLPAAPTMTHFDDTKVYWEAVVGATGYAVETLSSGTVWQGLGQTSDLFFAVTLVPDEPAYVRVRAINSAGSGPASAALYYDGQPI